MSSESCANCGKDVTNEPRVCLCEKCFPIWASAAVPCGAGRATESDAARARVLLAGVRSERPEHVAQALADERAGAERRAAAMIRELEAAGARRLSEALQRERELLRRAVGVVSDVATLEREIHSVLDAFAATGIPADPASRIARCRHEFAPSATTRAPVGPCRKCGATPGTAADVALGFRGDDACGASSRGADTTPGRDPAALNAWMRGVEWVCTLPKGHPGEHAAASPLGHLLARWPAR